MIRAPQTFVRQLVPLTVAVFLFSAAVAGAKELPVEICGAAGCVTVSDRGSAGFLHSTGTSTAAPDPAPFFVVRFGFAAGVRSPGTWSYVYVPSRRAMRADDFGSGRLRWMAAPFLAPAIAESTENLEPYPPSPTWTPSVAARDEDSPFAWLALGTPAAMLAILRIIQGFRSVVTSAR